MGNILLDRTARVIVVERSGAARQLLTEVLRTAGFNSVQGMASLADVFSMLETEQCDWIISSFDNDADRVNALSLMQLCTEHAELRSLRFSLLAGDDEQQYLLKAFQLGLIAWHSKPFTKDSFQDSFEEFLASVQKYNGQQSLIAAEYLRRLLRESEMYEDLISMEKNLIGLYPGNARLLLNLAESYYLLEEPDRASSLIVQVRLLDPDLEDDADALQEQYGDDSSSDTQQGSSNINILGIETVVIVDTDETILNSVSEILKENGVTSIHVFTNGADAAKFIKEHPNPDLVIHEWRLPGLSGPIFIQRIVNEGATTTPIILLSSLIQPSEMPLLKEMGVATIIPKPFDKEEFFRSLIWTLQQDRIPTDQGIAEIKIRRLLAAGQKDSAAKIIGRFLEDKSMLDARKKLVEAEWAYFNCDYEAARDAGLAALVGSGDSINILNILGKAFMQLRDFESALKCLDKAQVLSPKNIERLCHIAEAQSELGDTEAAKSKLEQATDLDTESETVADSKVKVAMIQGDTATAKQMMGHIEQLGSIVAYMNNKAVAHARCGNFEKSIDQYHKTIEALPEDRTQLRSLVYYNLALALARASKLDGSLKYLDLALKLPNKKIQSKARSLKKRIVTAIKSGADFRLLSNKSAQPGDERAQETTSHDSESNAQAPKPQITVLNSITVEPGDIGCFLVYRPASALEGENLIKTLTFARRSGIERAETLKAERAKKAG